MLEPSATQQDLFTIDMTIDSISKEEKRETKPKQQEKTLPDSVSPLGRKLWELLSQGSLSMEELVEQSDTDFTAVSIELLEMQVAGLVKVDQMQRYRRS